MSASHYEVREFLDKGILDFGVFFDPFDLPNFEHVQIPNRDVVGLIVKKESRACL